MSHTQFYLTACLLTYVGGLLVIRAISSIRYDDGVAVDSAISLISGVLITLLTFFVACLRSA